MGVPASKITRKIELHPDSKLSYFVHMIEQAPLLPAIKER